MDREQTDIELVELGGMYPWMRRIIFQLENANSAAAWKFTSRPHNASDCYHRRADNYSDSTPSFSSSLFFSCVRWFFFFFFHRLANLASCVFLSSFPRFLATIGKVLRDIGSVFKNWCPIVAFDCSNQTMPQV